MSKFISKSGQNIDAFQNRLSRSYSLNENYQPFRPSLLNPNHPNHKSYQSQTSSDEPTITTPLLKPNIKSERDEDKLNTFEGVYIQVVLSIWGVILFLRLGYILGQVGYLVTMLMFFIGYSITTFTTLSIAAISTNGFVRGGGPYYMISRSLGPEFGGSIGMVVYLGTCLNGVLNALASVEGIIEFFGLEHGTIYKILPERQSYLFIYGTLVILISLFICFLGSKVVAKITIIFGMVLLISTLSILFTFLIQSPFVDPDPSKHLNYTSFSLETFYGNLYPNLHENDSGIMETFQSIFGVLFPACIGIMAGASMSGNLKNPSKSIPKGTFWAIGTTFIAYVTLTTMFAFTVPRDTLVSDINVLSHIGLFPPLVNIGVLSTAISSTFSCFIGASKIVQAIARDHLLPGLSIFGYGTSSGDEPIVAFLLTYALAQVLLFAGDINMVAGIVTMFFVLTFGVTNLACFSLKVGSAPNFRPSFQYFKAWTAFVGVLLCFGAMFYVSPTVAALSTTFASFIFALVHFTSPPKPWGDVTQSLIYHQVRKYLLRLDVRKEHVKFWRPQILLLVNDPRNNYQLIQFCNALKKGSLYVIGHILKGDLRHQLSELKRQRSMWLKLVDVTHIKAFIHLSVALNEKLGARDLLLGAGLGGMVPNIVVMGGFNLKHYRKRLQSKLDDEVQNESEIDSKFLSKLDSIQTSIDPLSFHLGNLLGPLPTDEMKSELPISITDYVSIIEDSLLLGKAVALGFGFNEIPLAPCLPREQATIRDLPGEPVGTIDLWPIQMAAPGDDTLQTANFDSYTMVLQLGCILHMVYPWKQSYKLRVCCFVEHQVDVEEERRRVQLLLDNLRIPAQLHVFWLDGGAVPEYNRVFNTTIQTPEVLPTSHEVAIVNPNSSSSQPSDEHTPTFVSSSMRINVPIPLPDDPSDTPGSRSQSSSGSTISEEEGSDLSDQLSEFIIDLDGGYRSPQEAQSGTTETQFKAKEFNELPALVQYRILNQLIRDRSKGAKVVISTLPAPEVHCSETQTSAEGYCASLETLTHGLPPTFLVHAKSLTVTTSL